jgi:hypothetical protein
MKTDTEICRTQAKYKSAPISQAKIVRLYFYSLQSFGKVRWAAHDQPKTLAPTRNCPSHPV